MSATEAQIRANRENAQKSTGPKSEAGKDRVKNNALKHGMRSRDGLVLPQEDPAELELRLREWIEDWNPANAIERELVTLAARASWALERTERYEAALLSQRVREALLRSKARRLEEVGELGRRLFTQVSRGPASTEIDHPAAIAAALEDSPEGVRWMIDRWGEFRGLIATNQDWTYSDYFKFVRLLGKRPIDAVDDPELNAIFLAWEVLEEESGVDFWGRMQATSSYYPAFNSSREWRELAPRPVDEAEAVARLLAVVDGEVERLKERLAVVEEVEGDDAVELAERASFAADDAGERLRRAQSARTREMLRAIQTLTKLRKDAAREPGKRVPAAPAERERPDEGEFPRLPVARPLIRPSGAPSPTRGEGGKGALDSGSCESRQTVPMTSNVPTSIEGRPIAQPDAAQATAKRHDPHPALRDRHGLAASKNETNEPVESTIIDGSAHERTRPGAAAV